MNIAMISIAHCVPTIFAQDNCCSLFSGDFRKNKIIFLLF